jgi:hypothetical protein
VLLARRQFAPAGGSGAGVPPPPGFQVSCPTEVAPGSWSDWTAPCDTQLYSGVELPVPAGFYGCAGLDHTGQKSEVCRILPDGTPLYEYALDGIPWNERTRAPVQTYFAGLPLTHPLKVPTTWLGDTAWPAHTHRKDIVGSPAPFAWHDYTATGGGYGVDKKGFYPMQGIPYVPKPFAERLGLNDLKSFACNALKTGLTIGGPALELVGTKAAMPGASKLATTFYAKACG